MDKRDFLKGSAAAAATMMLPAFTATSAFADDPVPRTNWSGSYHYSTSKVLQPATVSDVQDAVRLCGRLYGIAENRIIEHEIFRELLVVLGIDLKLDAWADPQDRLAPQLATGRPDCATH